MSEKQPRRSVHLEQLESAACEMSSFDEGHDLHPIIRRAALATPSQWVDAVVVTASVDGTVSLVRLEDSSPVVLWHHADLGDIVEPGSPVALHGVYGVLAIGDELVSVRAA
ncbi:MAG: hypothetical protein JWP75_2573 [Frondihabitans sp.]|nr:hypothetical protein [Frondihabitans sp.]